MHISDDVIPGAAGHTGPVLVYLECGRISGGFVLRADEFVTSLAALDEARQHAGLTPCSFRHPVSDL